MQNNNVTYFDSFGVEHIPKEIKTFIGNKKITTNIFRIQAYNSIMCRYFNMDDFNKKQNIYPSLNVIPLNANISNEQQFRLNKINEIKYYFLAEIRETELISKSTSKYIASLDYFDKSLNVLSILSGSISIASFASVIGAPAGIIGASCGLTFSITSGFAKKFLKTIRNKKKKHNKIVMLARSKLNSIESKISKALMDNEISHEDFETIINEEKKY